MQNHSFVSKPENMKADECVICERPKLEHRDHIQANRAVSPADGEKYGHRTT